MADSVDLDDAASYKAPMLCSYCERPLIERPTGDASNPHEFRTTEVFGTPITGFHEYCRAQRRRHLMNRGDLLAEVERLRSVLAECEWAVDHGCCPLCGRSETRGHASDCRLDAALNG